MTCPWCQDDNADDYSPLLCRYHVAEYEGTSLDGLDRMEAAERADMDALGFNDNYPRNGNTEWR